VRTLDVTQLEEAGEDASCIRRFLETHGPTAVVTLAWAGQYAEHLHWSRLAERLLSKPGLRQYDAEKALACLLYLRPAAGPVDSKSFNQHVALSFTALFLAEGA
jgi:hypothetical protein